MHLLTKCIDTSLEVTRVLLAKRWILIDPIQHCSSVYAQFQGNGAQGSPRTQFLADKITQIGCEGGRPTTWLRWWTEELLRLFTIQHVRRRPTFTAALRLLGGGGAHDVDNTITAIHLLDRLATAQQQQQTEQARVRIDTMAARASAGWLRIPAPQHPALQSIDTTGLILN
jgi:hypothetical protein